MIIGLDLDDVLLDFFDTFRAFVNKNQGTSYDRSSMKHFHIEKSWGWTKEDAAKAIVEFYNSTEHLNASTIPGAIEAVRKLSQDNTLHVVTSKPDVLRQPTEKWLETNFPGMFKGIHFMNHYHSEGKKRTKAEVCRELGVEIFVDDSLEQARNVSNIGITVLLPDTPWNQEKVELPITRVYSWPEIVELIGRQK